MSAGKQYDDGAMETIKNTQNEIFKKWKKF